MSENLISQGEFNTVKRAEEDLNSLLEMTAFVKQMISSGQNPVRQKEYRDLEIWYNKCLLNVAGTVPVGPSDYDLPHEPIDRMIAIYKFISKVKGHGIGSVGIKQSNFISIP
jgi:hypothetical protein